jgi:2'-5' RNA ligase
MQREFLRDKRNTAAPSLVEPSVSPEIILGVRHFIAIPVLTPLPDRLQSVRKQFYLEATQLGKMVHMSLCAPFEANADRISEVVSEMGAVASRFESFDLTFSDLMTFPDFGVLALRPDDDRVVKVLHRSILAAVGHYREQGVIEAETLRFGGERWLPHLTLAKGEHLRGNSLQKAYQAAEGFIPFSVAVTQIAWVAEQFDNRDSYFYLPLGTPATPNAIKVMA